MKRRGFLTFFGTSAGVTACTCLVDPSDDPFPKEDGRSILFRGAVQSRKPLPPATTGHKRYSATFRVHEYWRGKVAATTTIEVKMTMGGGDCLQDGLGYLNGEEYLVYAYREQSSEAYIDNAACVPVGLVRNLPKVTEALGRGRAPEK